MEGKRAPTTIHESQKQHHTEKFLMNYATKFMLAHMRYRWKALEKQILMMSFTSVCNLQARSNRRFKLTNQLQGFRCVTITRDDVMLMSLLSGHAR